MERWSLLWCAHLLPTSPASALQGKLSLEIISWPISSSKQRFYTKLKPGLWYTSKYRLSSKKGGFEFEAVCRNTLESNAVVKKNQWKSTKIFSFSIPGCQCERQPVWRIFSVEPVVTRRADYKHFHLSLMPRRQIHCLLLCGVNVSSFIWGLQSQQKNTHFDVNILDITCLVPGVFWLINFTAWWGGDTDREFSSSSVTVHSPRFFLTSCRVNFVRTRSV